MQCEDIEGLRYEIIVADDGSTDKHTCHINKEILELENARYILRKENVGRAAIRNFLADEASYEWLLFIDSDMTMLLDDFILHYIELDNSFKVAYGGYQLGNGEISNLRYLYEKNQSCMYTAIIIFLFYAKSVGMAWFQNPGSRTLTAIFTRQIC